MVISNGSLEVGICYVIHIRFFLVLLYYTVGCATKKDATMNECYNECGGILFVVESSVIVFTRERFFMLYVCV